MNTIVFSQDLREYLDSLKFILMLDELKITINLLLIDIA